MLKKGLILAKSRYFCDIYAINWFNIDEKSLEILENSKIPTRIFLGNTE